MSTRLVTLVDRLVDQTNYGSVAWEATETEAVFMVSFPDYSIRVSRRSSGASWEEDDIVLTIYDSHGSIVEQVDDNVLGGQGMVEAYGKLSKMYETARRKAMGVDQAIDSIIKALDDDLPF